MPRAAKIAAVLREDGRAKKSKQELAFREQEEKKLLTGRPLQVSEEVRSDPVAMKEFRRVKGLLGAIGKDDALYSSQMNRYCLLVSEIRQLEERKKKMEKHADAADDPKDAAALYKLIAGCDRDIMSIRRMMMNIERENVMTVAAALRSIPKKPDKAENPLLKVLRE